MSNEQKVEQKKEELKTRTSDEILAELKQMHVELSKQILNAVKDSQTLKDDLKHVDSFNMTTMHIQAMNICSYFTAIRIRMIELEKQVEALKNNQNKKETKDASNIK